MSTEPSDPSVDIADVPVAPEPSNEASHVSEHPITANGNTLEPLSPHTDPTDTPKVNGEAHDVDQQVESLKNELETVRNEKEHLETQYRSLLGKLTTMRNTLGDKLRQDADELDRRAGEIAELRQSNADLTYTSETLRSELVQANEESASLSQDLSSLKSRVSESNHETEDALQEAEQDIEELRMQVEQWENEAGRERLAREEYETALDGMSREMNLLQLERDSLSQERDREKESAHNLGLVLHDFQISKDREIHGLTNDLRMELQSATRMMSEYKQRAVAAEAKLSSIQDESEQTAALRQELKEKNLLIGKVRHEAVILNEHLREALSRLRKHSSDDSVDRRLVTNVLLSFLTTPRADSKRFQMLQLISSVLSWTDDEREKAGLQRSSSTSANQAASSLSPPSTSKSASSSPVKKSHSRNKTAKISQTDDLLLGENESFSNLWVEYLLRESNSSSPTGRGSEGTTPPPMFSPPGSLPSTSGLNQSSMSSYFSRSGTSTSSPTPSTTRRPSVSSVAVSTGPSSVSGADQKEVDKGGT